MDKRNAKIGIVSYYDTQDNYGQVLQCFALQQALKSIGYSNVFHLRHTYSKPSFKEKLIMALDILIRGYVFDVMQAYIKRYRRNQNLVFLKRITKDNQRGFDDFRKKYINLSDRKYTIQELKKEAPEVDAWIAGSDQIWCSPSDLFQLQFGHPGEKRIAYAASMGGTKFESGYLRYKFSKNLRQFDYISLREDDGVETCRQLGYKNSEFAPDPTLLLSKEDYDQIKKTPALTKKNYLFLYLLGNPISLNIKEIYSWASENNLEVIYVASQGVGDDKSHLSASPEEWIGLISQASYVITNSFHCTVFSIIYNKQFLVLPIVGEWARMNSRTTSLFKLLDIPPNRIYEGDINEIKKTIDYKKCEVKLDELRYTYKNKIESILNI